MRNRVWVAAGAAAVLAAVTAGCSGGQDGQSGQSGRPAGAGPPAKVVQAAYKATTAAHTAKVDMKTVTRVKGRSMSMNGHGVTDFDKKDGQFNMALPNGAGALELRFLNGRAYEKLPPQAAAQLGGATPWISFDANAVAKKALGAGAGQLGQGTPKDPSAQLSYLRGVSDKGIHKIGTERVHGVQTTHYKGDIDWDKALADAKQAAQQMEKLTGSRKMPVDVWVDKQGRVAQMQFTETIHPQALAGGAKSAQTGPITSEVTESLSDYGTPVHVSAPPKNQTTDVTDKLTGKLHGGGH